MEQTGAAKPLWRRIWDFPMVAMLVAGVCIIAAMIASQAIKPYVPLAPKTPLSDFVRPMITVLAVIAVYKLVVTRLGAQPRDDLPFTAQGARQLGLGLLFGALLFSAVVAVAAALDVYNVVRLADARDLVWSIFGFGLYAGVFEEILFRGIIFRWLEEWLGSWAGLIISSALFGLGHAANPGATAVSTIFIMIEAGLIFVAFYMLTRNLWLCVGLHAAWNAVQGGIYDVPVSGNDTHGLVEAQLSGPEILSGGPFGLEASVIALVILTAAGAWVMAKAIRKGELVQPMWVRRRLERERVSVPVTA